MNGDVSRLSYETFKFALQKESTQINDRSPKVMNSTMVDKVVIEASKNSRTETEKLENPMPANGRRRVIPLPVPYRCQECGKEFQKIEYLRVHLMKHLSGIGNGTSHYVCRHAGCNRHFSNKQEGKNHEVRHVAAGNFNCERIQKVFKYKRW